MKAQIPWLRPFGLWSSLVALSLCLGASSAHAVCETPDVVIMLDRSGSMNGSKWAASVNAIRQITNQYKGKLRFGLGSFSSSAGINYGVDACIRDGVNNRCVSNLQSTLGRLGPGGGTNLKAGINVCRSHLQAIRNADPVKNRKRSVMFITDGRASCASPEVQTLFRTLGVKTYVIGFGSGVDGNCLSAMATAGQTALAGSRKYYQADNQSQLNAAMKAIADASSKEICNNLDDDCNGKIDDGLSRRCNTACGAGIQICGAGQWKACSAQNPKPEVCNGRDDNCNGRIDEIFTTKGQACQVGKGVCLRRGTFKCKADGTGVECSVRPGTPTSEICDGLDNDCDGSIDEIFPNKGNACKAGQGACQQNGTLRCSADKRKLECSVQGGNPTAEKCDGIDNDCDGKVDERLTKKCSTACETAQQQCKNGNWTVCPARKPTTELCDGLDNDCDGKVDETWAKRGKTCNVGKGECKKTGRFVCTADKRSLECSVQPGNPKTELCDGKDNDCDGRVDEDWSNKGKECGSGVGACSQKGKYVCKADGSGTQCSVAGGKPEPEKCDGIDNDCNGQVDENLVQACKSQCEAGTQTCKAGKWSECSARKPSREVCNGRDDDCNGDVDDDLKRKCSTDCEDGEETCVNGKWEFCDAQKPEPEVCDGKDNDCDGQIDEVDPKSCQGACGKGTAFCRNGKWAGCSGPQPKAEECDGKDNDCNGKIDDNLKRDCKNDCGSGTELCLDGEWKACSAARAQPEICDGKDNDCDGKPDNNAKCPQGTTCVDGECRAACRKGECQRGLRCSAGYCVGDACKSVKCKSNQRCLGGRCVELCSLVTCKSGLVCKNGQCVPNDCYLKGCPKGKKCLHGACMSDPCEGVSCTGKQFCRDGKCIDSCADAKCGDDQLCVDGKCKIDPKKSGDCASVFCKTGEFCEKGKCVVDPCAGVECAPGRSCKDGRCEHDPCANIQCPGKQLCYQGQCYGQGDYPGPGGNNAGSNGDNSGGNGTNGANSGENSGNGNNSGSNGDNSGTNGNNTGSNGDNSGTNGDNSGGNGNNTGSNGDNSGGNGNAGNGDGGTNYPDGWVANPDDGTVVLPDGRVVDEDQVDTLPDGRVVVGSGGSQTGGQNSGTNSKTAGTNGGKNSGGDRFEPGGCACNTSGEWPMSPWVLGFFLLFAGIRRRA